MQNKTFTTIFLLFVWLVWAQNPTFAQNPYTWENFKIKFSLPDGYKIVENTAEKFEGNAPGIASFGIYPFKDAKLTEADLKEYASSIAKQAGMDMGSAVVDLIEFNGFKGGYAEGKVQGVSVIVLGLINPSSDVNFFVQVVYTDADAAIRFIRSIESL
jgi:hypothetical protein